MSFDKITCKECGAHTHAIQLHLKESHPEMTLEAYQAAWPGEPIMSEIAKKKLEERLAAKVSVDMAVPAMATVTPLHTGPQQVPLHEVFGLGAVKAAMSGRGSPIPITVFPSAGAFDDMVPEVDPNYVYEIEDLKNVLMGMELNIPTYVWGHAGTGKTTLLEQICARTKRPLLRVQHTINTEEAHITGQWTVRDGNTVYQPGPLTMAMKYGWIYLADEYDFAMASVLSVYQPVLEGKSLMIKDADDEHRVVKPHPNFRFLATGNTNGSGDETGLYQGTQMQNSANYDRFGVVVEKRYMAPALEAQAIAGQAGITRADADKMVDFANRVRQQFESNQISSTVSPRALINAAKLGLRRSSWRAGLNLAFINKLSRVDRAAVDGLAQRVFKDTI